MTAEGLSCLVMLMGRSEGAREEVVFWARKEVFVGLAPSTNSEKLLA